MKVRFLTLVLLFFQNNIAFGGGNPTLAWQKKSILHPSDWSFKENKGQLLDENRKPLPEIKYYGEQGGVNIYCKAGMIAFVFTKVEHDSANETQRHGGNKEGRHPEFISGSHNNSIKRHDEMLKQVQHDETITAQRTELIFLNSNPNVEIAATEQQTYYENYYTTGDADHGITDVHTFKTVTYKNIYPNIDLNLHSKEHGMKYEFLVHTGGKVSDIQMQWKGLDSMEMLESGGVKYVNGLGEIAESKPKCFVSNVAVVSKFSKVGNVVGFDVGVYDKGKDLLIDPSLVWGTYYGGALWEHFCRIVVDKSDNIFLAGETNSTTGIATKGAYKTTYSNRGDIFLIKLSPSDSLIWGTYYGGNDAEMIQDLAIDNKGNPLFTGSTWSLSGIATKGAYKTTGDKNGYDAFIAKFSTAGGLLWGTFYGGDDEDEGEGIASDSKGNIFIVGRTSSANGIATKGAFKDTLKEYDGDGFITKFSSSGSLIWGTYYGGNDGDGASEVAIDNKDNVIITGLTQSPTNIATSGSYQTSCFCLKPWNEAFVVKFSNSGFRLWGSYFSGKKDEEVFGVTTDSNNDITIAGYTRSDSGIATQGAYQTKMRGSDDIYLAKFSSSGSLIWSTYFGGDSSDETIRGGITSDKYNNLYISGYTSSINGIATKDAYQTSNKGKVDGFFAKFNPTAGYLIWGSYYGGDSFDYCYDICVDASGSIIIAGETESTTGIASSGSYKTSLQGHRDAFIAKFSYQCNLTTPHASDTSICGTQKVTLKAFGGNSKKYRWSSKPNNGEILDTNSTYTIVATHTDTFYVSSFNDTCESERDSVIVTVNFPIDTILSMNTCAGYLFNGVKLVTSGTYYDTFPNKNGCDSVVTLKLTINTRSDSTLSASVCKGTSYLFNGNNLTQAGTYYDTLINSNGCDSIITLNLNLIPTPSTPSIVKSQKDSLQSSVMGTKYLWFKNGIALYDSSRTIHLSGSGTYKLIVMNDSCTSDTSMPFIQTGIKESSNEIAEIHITPNPSSNLFFVRLLCSDLYDAEVLITDILGKEIMQSNIGKRRAFIVNLQNYGMTKGIYFLTIQCQSGVYTSMMVLE